MNLVYTSYPIKMHNFVIRTHSVYMLCDTGAVIVCQNFKKDRERKTKVFCYIPKEQKWIMSRFNNEYIDMMYNLYNSKHKTETKEIRRINYKKMMSHSRKKKHGNGGEILRKWNGNVTDYECSKEPLHDFRRVYY